MWYSPNKRQAAEKKKKTEAPAEVPSGYFSYFEGMKNAKGPEDPIWATMTGKLNPFGPKIPIVDRDQERWNEKRPNTNLNLAENYTFEHVQQALLNPHCSPKFIDYIVTHCEDDGLVNKALQNKNCGLDSLTFVLKNKALFSDEQRMLVMQHPNVSEKILIAISDVAVGAMAQQKPIAPSQIKIIEAALNNPNFTPDNLKAFFEKLESTWVKTEESLDNNSASGVLREKLTQTNHALSLAALNAKNCPPDVVLSTALRSTNDFNLVKGNLPQDLRNNLTKLYSYDQSLTGEAIEALLKQFPGTWVEHYCYRHKNLPEELLLWKISQLINNTMLLPDINNIVSTLKARAAAHELPPKCMELLLESVNDYGAQPWAKELLKSVYDGATSALAMMQHPGPLEGSLWIAKVYQILNRPETVMNITEIEKILKNPDIDCEKVFFETIEVISKALAEPQIQTGPLTTRAGGILNALGKAIMENNLAESSMAIYDFFYTMLEESLANPAAAADALFSSKWIITLLTRYPHAARAWELYSLLNEKGMKMMCPTSFTSIIEGESGLSAEGGTLNGKPWYRRGLLVPQSDPLVP